VQHLLRIERADILSPAAQSLIQSLNAEVQRLYPEHGTEDHVRLDPREFAPGRGAFLIAYLADHPIACGAIRRIDPTTGEIKRMYVREAHRNQGVARAVLAALESEARALGFTRLVLETGPRQPAAVALYTRAGYTVIPPFADHMHSPLSICMGNTL
jgi:GNAT superfamily N-acetyltransferase